MPTQPYVPEPHHAGRVFELAAIGMPKDDIAAEIGLSARKLNRLYRDQLRKGAAQGHEQVLQTLHEVARKGTNATVLTLYVKAQCGWRDTGNPHTNGSIVRISYSYSEKSQPQEQTLDQPPLP